MTTVADIAQIVSSTLSPDSNTRISAELQLAEQFASPGAGLALSQLILAQDAEISLRQMTCVVLRKYVNERWSPFFSGFRGSAPPPEVKTQIRQNVFQALSDKNRKMRTLCAHTLSSIASCDWPEEYPDLLHSLIALLSSGSPDSVHGAMQVFTEFIKSDLTEDQILPVLRELLPVLLNILGAPESYDAATRARTISVFRQCVTSLFMVKDQHPQSVKEASASVLPVWLEAFKVLLSIDPQQDLAVNRNWDGLAVRIQIFKTLYTIHTSFPRALVPFITDYLNLSLTHLVALYPVFTHYYIQSSESVPRTSEDEVIELPQLICPILDFMTATSRSIKARPWWFESTNLPHVIPAIFNFLQITDDDEETWTTNANAFIAEEDDDTSSYSVRVASLDLLAALVDKEPQTTISVFQNSLTQVISASQQAKESGSTDWWRPLEAALVGVGSQAKSIEDCLEEAEESQQPAPIDIQGFLTNFIPSVIGLFDYPFLQGRALIFAGQFAKLLPPHLASQYIEAAASLLEAEASIPSKVSAVKATNYLCSSENQVIAAFSARLAKALVPLSVVATEDSLTLVLQALTHLVGTDRGQWITLESADSFTGLILDIWVKNTRDPIFVSILTDFLQSLSEASVNGIYEVVAKRALPTLSDAIANVPVKEPWVAASGLDLVNSVLRGARNDAIGEGFFARLAPALFKVLGETDDRDVLQQGISCLTLIVRKEPQQLLAWNDESGRSGLEYVLTVVARMLENADESGGLVIGDLIIHLLRKAGTAVLPVLPQLLQAMIRRMTTAKTATFLQSLIIPIIFLVNNQPNDLLTLLETTEFEGRSALDIFIQTWCENAETFQGFWPQRVSTLGLTQLFVSERPSLQNLMVKGDIIVKPETKNVIMTRSKTKAVPHEFTSVPFPVKVLKLVLRDVKLGGESATLATQVPAAESDDEEEEWSDDERIEATTFLSDFLGPDGLPIDEDTFQFDDTDALKDDPIWQIDIHAHLLSFFKECAARNSNNFSGRVDQLSVEEITVVRQIVSVAQAAPVAPAA